MKKLLILAMTLALGSAAFAAPAPAKHAPANMNGTIEKYDAATKTLTVKHDGSKETTFQINDKSEVMKGKSKADASALATSTGQSVKVAYVMEGANRIAERIDVAAAHLTPAKTPMKKK